MLILLFSNLSFATEQYSEKILISNDTMDLYTYPLTHKIRLMSNRPKFKKYSGGTACFRGYVATWEISNDSLFLRNVATCPSMSIGITDKFLKKLSTVDEFAPFYDTLANLKGATYSHRLFSQKLEEILDKKNAQRLFSFCMFHSEYIRLGWGFQYQFDVDLLLSQKKLAPRPDNASPVFFPWYSGVLEIPRGKEISRGGFFKSAEHLAYTFIHIDSGKVIKTEEVPNDSGVTVYLRYGEPNWNALSRYEFERCLYFLSRVSAQWNETSKSYGLRQLKQSLLTDINLFIRAMRKIDSSEKIYPLVSDIQFTEDEKRVLINKLKKSRKSRRIRTKLLNMIDSNSTNR